MEIFATVEVEADEPVEHDLSGGGENHLPGQGEWQRAAPGYILVHCSIKTLGSHEMMRREGVLGLELKTTALYPSPAALTASWNNSNTISLDISDGVKLAFLAGPS